MATGPCELCVAGGIGRLLGAIMLPCFATLFARAVANILAAPQILAALNPWHALGFVNEHRLIAFIALGAWDCEMRCSQVAEQISICSPQFFAMIAAIGATST